MQLFQQPFDARTVKPNEAFEPLPAGWYNARITNSEAKPTKDNESGYLLVELEIIDGEYKSRKVFDRLNLWNKSVQASEIAQRQLSAYCHATGVFVLQDSNQLHGIPIKIKVAVKQDPNYEPSNEVRAVKHIQDGTPAPVGNSFAPPSAPFGQNAALPSQPPSFVQGLPAVANPANTAPPLGQPAAMPTAPQFPPAPASTAATAMPQWTPPTAQSQPAPTAGPVPPWRK